MKNLFILFTALVGMTSHAQSCPNWGESYYYENVSNKIPESSGLAFSKGYQGTFYQHNDSGDGPYIYRQTLNQTGVDQLVIPNFIPRDVEDMALGFCPGANDSCLFIGDIGDNKRKRSEIKLVIIKEPSISSHRLQVVQKITMNYPDGPHNAEALAVHPNGDVFILTKELRKKKGTVKSAQLYRLSAKKILSGGHHILEYYGEISVPTLQPHLSVLGQTVTAMDIAPGGKKFIVLTYENAFEVNYDLSLGPIKNSRSWTPGVNFLPINIEQQVQQEAIAYLYDNSFFFTSEDSDRFSRAKIYGYRCTK